MRRLRYAASAAALALALGACGGSDDPEPDTTPTATTPTATPSSTPTSPAPSTGSSSPTASGVPTGGTADRPAVVEPTTELLDWQAVDAPVTDTVTRSGGWTLTVPRNSASYSLENGGQGTGSGTPGTRVSDALIDGDWAVAVLLDKAERRPAVAEVTDLTTGRTFRIDGRSEVPTTTGGTWALGEGRLVHATVASGAYCLTTVDLASRTSTLGWCAAERQGFTDARITPAGTALQTFDDSSPACRTLVTVDGDQVAPFEGVPDCKGWDGLLTDDGAVWSVIPKEHQIENAHFYARSGEAYVDLGPGTAGSLTWCAGAAYFVRDPQREGDPAALMRWSPDGGLAVVYESPGGQAFLSEPRCGGDTLTVTALAEDGDEQVSATLP